MYVWLFWQELYYLLLAAFGNRTRSATCSMPSQRERRASARRGSTRRTSCSRVLGLIDVVMIANLLIMVIVGGYETFVSRLNLKGHPDQPEWLSHVNAGVLKVKLATALIGISSIHLLKTFINAEAYNEKTLIAQVGIHITFLLSALAIAATDRLLPRPPYGKELPQRPARIEPDRASHGNVDGHEHGRRDHRGDDWPRSMRSRRRRSRNSG